MTDIETIAPPPPPPPPSQAKPLQRHQQIETDTFCGECGYNLHGQPIAVDEHLGLRVCRCPECGKYHAAGRESTASSLWLSRVATLALAFWMLIVLSAIFWLCIGIGAVMVVHVEEFSYRRTIAADGREVQWSATPGGTAPTLVYVGTTQPVANPELVQTVRTAGWSSNYYGSANPRQVAEWRRQQLLVGSTVLGLSDLGLGLVSGVLLVTFFWHWKRSRYRLVVVLPFAVAAVVLSVMLLDDDYEFIRGWVVSRVLMHAALIAFFMYVGILIGRPVARALLRMFIPPRPRQVFAFLWRADGKTPPGAVA